MAMSPNRTDREHAKFRDGASDELTRVAIKIEESIPLSITGGGGSGGTSQADKSAFTEGTTDFTPVGGVYNETISADPTEDQAAAARITAKRAVHTNLRANDGTEIGTASAPVRVDPTGSTAQPVSDNGGSLTVDGTVAATQSGSWSVDVNNAAGASAVNIQDGGNSITVDGTVAATQSGTWVLGANSGVDIGDVTINNAAGASAVNVQDGGNSLTVDGTVAATQSGTWVLGANSGVDIGDVTINNAAGASAVNIQDGGNSITVDGTVAATQSGTWVLGANSGVDIGDVTINNAAGASAVNIQDGGNSITIDGSLTNISGTISLPTGAATAANQVTGNSTLSSIASSTGTIEGLLGDLSYKEGTPPIIQDFLAVGGARIDFPTGIGDFELGTFRMTAYRGLHVHSVDSGGNTINQSTSAPEHSMNGAFSKAQAIGGQLDDTSTTAATENNVAPVRITAQRGLHANLRNASGTEIGTNASPAYVRHTDGTNNMPAGDAGARGIFTKVYDGSAFFNVPWTIVNAGGFGSGAVSIANPTTLATCLVTATGELPCLVASTDNTLANAKYLQVDGSRSLATYNAGSTRASYSAAVNGLVTAATATDVFTVLGSATKTVKVTQILISGVATTAISVPVDIVIRSTADSGGTSTTPTIVKHDSGNAAATAVVRAYTANPTTGTLVGSIRSERISFTLTGVVPSRSGYDFGVRPSQPIVLRGTSEQLCVNFNSTTVVGPLINIWVEFTEE